ncbi:unnamed protein product [Brassica rapa]|uniref:TIR domain-containing protein n=1 Tax=Brassica campestris TaxID=3711 RepID=A0A3P6AUN3_BRACM|nr:unnamed protein product [Brassica rapa]VDC91513.1 unnamed protein product [Brassica rapa]
MTPFYPCQDPQVFINYRGEELRYRFVSHLVAAFERDEINFFIDKNELRGTDLRNLFARIHESRIALVIFSNRYAESSWCMNELAKIKELADKEKLHVVPISYKLKVGDVRGQTGKFGTKFWNLARASTGDQIKTWKEALECISDKMGLFSKTAFGDDAQGSVWSAGLLGIVGGSIRCCAHPSAVASPWLLMVVSVALMLLAGLRAVQVLVQRSTCSRLLAYRSWFGGHRVSKPLAGRGAFEDCIEGLRAIFNDVTEIPGIRGNEVNLTFPWSTSKGRTALDS